MFEFHVSTSGGPLSFVQLAYIAFCVARAIFVGMYPARAASLFFSEPTAELETVLRAAASIEVFLAVLVFLPARKDASFVSVASASRVLLLGLVYSQELPFFIADVAFGALGLALLLVSRQESGQDCAWVEVTAPDLLDVTSAVSFVTGALELLGGALLALGVGCDAASLSIELRAFSIMTCVSGLLQLATTMVHAAPPRSGRPSQSVDRPDWTMRWAAFHICAALGIAAVIVHERISEAASGSITRRSGGGVAALAGHSPFLPMWCEGGTPELAAVAGLHALGSCLLLLGRDVRRRRLVAMKEE